MKREEFFKALLEKAKALGCEAAETYFAASEAFSVNVLDGDFDRYEAANANGVGLRVCVNGRDGYAYTEAFDAPEALVARAIDNARTIETDEVHPMQGRCEYQAVTRPVSPLERLSEKGRIELALAMERAAKAADTRVQRVESCEVGVSSGRVAMANTLGLAAARETGLSYCCVSPIVEEHGEVKTGFAFRVGAEALDVKACAEEAVRDALDKLGAAPAPSGSYRVVIKNEAMGDLLSAFSPVFSAENAQKGLSLLAGREGTRIGADCVSIIDNPFHPVQPRAFDGEGTPAVKKAVVENGVLKTLLHNLSTAKKAGCESTGNATRASAASTVGVGPTVFYLEPGKTSFEKLQETLGSGLVITGLEGLHAGLNTISGDFSLKAEGYLVENGARVRPVNGITLAGNFLSLLENVDCVGDDLKFGLPGRGCTGAPSVLIAALSVAGK